MFLLAVREQGKKNKFISVTDYLKLPRSVAGTPKPSIDFVFFIKTSYHVGEESTFLLFNVFPVWSSLSLCSARIRAALTKAGSSESYSVVTCHSRLTACAFCFLF